MTVDSAYFQEVYARESDTEYPFFIESTGLEAIQVFKQALDGTLTLLTNGFHYSIKFSEYRDPIFAQGTITLAAPLSSGASLVIRRKTPIETSFSVSDGNPFPTEQFEYTMDKATFILQEIEGTVCDCRGEKIEEVTPGDTDVPEPVLTECLPYACDAYDSYVSSQFGGISGEFVVDVSETAATTAEARTLFGFPVSMGGSTLDFNKTTTLGGGESSVFTTSDPQLNFVDDCGGTENIKVARVDIIQSGGWPVLEVLGTDGTTAGNSFSGALVFKELSSSSSTLSNGGGVVLYARPCKIPFTNALGNEVLSGLILPEIGFNVDVSAKTISFNVLCAGTTTVANNRAEGPSTAIGLGTIDLDDSMFANWNLLTFQISVSAPFITDGYDFNGTGSLYEDLAITLNASGTYSRIVDGRPTTTTLSMPATTVYAFSSNYFIPGSPMFGRLKDPSAPLGEDNAFVLARARMLVASFIGGDATEFDVEKLYLALRRNNEDYTPPGYCGGLTVSPN